VDFVDFRVDKIRDLAISVIPGFDWLERLVSQSFFSRD
jgi:hypothetical protein